MIRETMEVSELFSFDFTYWFLQTVAMLVTALLIPKLKVTGPLGALVTVVALAFINSKLWDAALFFHVPNSLTTQTLMLFLANGIIFWILIKVLPGIEVEGFLAALIAPVVFTICSVLIDHYGSQIDWKKVLDVIIDLLSQARDRFKESVPTATPVPK